MKEKNVNPVSLFLNKPSVQAFLDLFIHVMSSSGPCHYSLIDISNLLLVVLSLLFLSEGYRIKIMNRYIVS